MQKHVQLDFSTERAMQQKLSSGSFTVSRCSIDVYN